MYADLTKEKRQCVMRDITYVTKNVLIVGYGALFFLLS